MSYRHIIVWVFAMALSLAATHAPSVGRDKEVITLSNNGLFARYTATPNPFKPYIGELFSPSGVQVLLDSPPDHVHHHGLMFALGAGEANFWEEKPADQAGRQVPRGKPVVHSFDSRTNPGVNNTWYAEQTLDWLAPGAKPQLTEKRTIMAHFRPECRLLEWDTVLTPAEGAAPVKLWGSHYFGLGLRLTPELNGKVRFIFPEGTPPGQVVRGEERLTSATWCAAAGDIGGKPVTVVMWEEENQQDSIRPIHPGQLKTVWFTMAKPFAYVSATLEVDAQPRMLGAKETLARRYAVAVFDGIADAAKIEKTIKEWGAIYLMGIDGGPLYGKR